MAISVFDLYSIGIGPSSSHTIGPMRAARKFALEVLKLEKTPTHVKVDLYGSLALTGLGHGTDMAVLLGLQGEIPAEVDPNAVETIVSTIRSTHEIKICGELSLEFIESKHLLFHKEKSLPYHPNGMRFNALDESGRSILERVYYSVGGGFIVDHETAKEDKVLGHEQDKLPFSFFTAKELLELSKKHQMTIAEIVMENEKNWRSEQEIRDGLLKIWQVMHDCIERGCEKTGILPGGLKVKRRAAEMKAKLEAEDASKHPAEVMEWISLWALAVNEENAACGRVVTAPTNGSAGVIPAVLKYYTTLCPNPTEEGIVNFLLTAGAIGILYKEGASISAAEMGCMGEVGVACSMAAAGLTAVMGGTTEQIENAAEIGMEHNLGLTCDPVMGLVQIPCIERNTMGAIKAVNAMLLAKQGDGTHRVFLDEVIATMRQTGHDMQSIYKETSQGGLAVNVPEC